MVDHVSLQNEPLTGVPVSTGTPCCFICRPPSPGPGGLWRVVVLALPQVMAAVACTGCFAIDKGEKWNYTLLDERRKDELVTVEEIKDEYLFEKVASTQNKAVFLYLVGRRVMGYDPQTFDHTGAKAKRRDFLEYLLTEEDPTVTCIRVPCVILGGHPVLHVCCNGRLWETYAGPGLSLDRYCDPATAALWVEKYVLDDSFDGLLPRWCVASLDVQEDIAKGHLAGLIANVDSDVEKLGHIDDMLITNRERRNIYDSVLSAAEYMSLPYPPGRGIFKPDHPFFEQYLQEKSKQLDRIVAALEKSTGMEHGRNWPRWRKALRCEHDMNWVDSSLPPSHPE